jgi:predicted dehydrogenase
LPCPASFPASALGLNGAVPPSERIVLGGMGVGNRGTDDLRWMLPEKDVQFVAICDAKKSQREAVKRIVDTKYGNKDCAMYRDMREFLATRTDIDALLIATGDRWHALASVMAMRAGKDVYSEKPSSMTIAEGQAVVATARRYGRIYQTGTQRLSEDNFTFANELLAHRPAGPRAYRPRPHRAVGRRRDEIRLARRRTGAAKG